MGGKVAKKLAYGLLRYSAILRLRKTIPSAPYERRLQRNGRSPNLIE